VILLDNVIKETISEALLRRAVIDDHMNELDAIPSKDELAVTYTFSARHETRMNALFKKEKLRKCRKVFFSAAKRVALFVVVFGSIFFGILLTSLNVRAVVRETIVEWLEKFTRYSYNSDITQESNAAWHFDYMPSGYEMSDTFVLGAATYVVYTDEGATEITLLLSSADDTSLGIDNEHSMFHMVYEHGIEYHIYESVSDDYPSQVIWTQDGVSMNLRGDCSVDELLRMAQSARSQD
jgi:hypothetical protein